MSTAAQNQTKPPVFLIPDPPHEFGQDGGKFYRCYDALAEEIDEDMAKGSKEQLDGILIFAGLFAGVNTAFLALTIPLLSADPADDTNALLAQNNALLMQLVAGRNDTLSMNSILPSASFSPSHDILTINALFSLSLSFAIISSFLAVLGRQWLVGYRKRSGGGPDRQRWEQLQRFLGVEHWRLKPILDDVLPSLLQIGLIIFCASLILYLHHLSPTISLIVGIPLCVGLAFFVGSALCTTRDRFCPFRSPLSNLLLWSARSLSSMLGGTSARLVKSVDHISSDSLSEESRKLLQATALQRVICTSDDPTALLCAMANTLSIRSPAVMERLWNEPAFQGRFCELFNNSHNGALQVLDYNVTPETAESARRLYCSAAAHILLTLDCGWESFKEFGQELCHFQMTTSLIPDELVLKSSSDLIRATMGFSFLCLFFDPYILTDAELKAMRNHLTVYSKAIAECSDHRCLSLHSWAVLQLHTRQSRWSPNLEVLRKVYRGEKSEFLNTLNKAFKVLLEPKSKDSFDCDIMLANMLRCVGRLMADERTDPISRLERSFKLLETCETVLRSSGLPDSARAVVTRLRASVVQFWTHKYDPKAVKDRFKEKSFEVLRSYLSHLGKLDRTEFGYPDDVEVLRLFCPLVWKLLFDEVFGGPSREYREQGGAVHEAFDAFLVGVNEVSRQIQSNSRRYRDPEQRWFQWQEQPLSIETTYNIP
ncbi:hypothetical protein M407DRAFT_26025 [Tulasnella calospora MUT 4182]|uniref:DUF6535 domain-containing protein n=1 Tax=Tulasnella calospora MUT 4182 TaxID=1051891 RepID=A0A0C3KSZ1_9AGAM|nr:hypothetical protein M407DRAFT_26025 [Tulasnella calospora MUT 4182]